MDQQQNDQKPEPKGDYLVGFIAMLLVVGWGYYMTKSDRLEADVAQLTRELQRARDDYSSCYHQRRQLERDFRGCQNSVESLGLRAEALSMRVDDIRARLNACRSLCYTPSP